MALPVRPPPPPPNDIAITGWSGITVRVAWTLLSMGVQVHSQVLRDARDHVFYHLEPGVGLPHAEDRAATLTETFVRRARGEVVRDPWAVDAEMPLSPRWRAALDQALTPLNEAILRHHYGDHRGLEWLANTFHIDAMTLHGARGGLREVVRRAAQADGVPIDQWPAERIDRLLRRLAAFAPAGCPSVLDLVGGAYVEHVAKCPRCDRTKRLLSTGLLDEEDLVPPSFGARPRKRASVMALHFHPEGRGHRATLAAELSVPHFPVGDDLLLVDWSKPEAPHAIIAMACEVGTPCRDRVRGALVEGLGNWTAHGLVGPLADRAALEVRSRSWGTLDETGELPAVLPEPPSSRPLWLAVAGLAVAVVVMVAWLLPSGAPQAAYPLDVAFDAARNGIWTAFDVDEPAIVTLVREIDGRPDVVLASKSAADKAALAVGDGSYRLHTMGPAVLLVSTAEPLDSELLARVEGGELDLDALASAVRKRQPSADLRLFRP